MIGQFAGLNIVESPLLTVRVGPFGIRRGWKKRLLEGIFTRHWAPRRRKEYFWLSLPNPEFIVTGNTVFMHPVMAQRLREELRRAAINPIFGQVVRNPFEIVNVSAL